MKKARTGREVERVGATGRDWKRESPAVGGKAEGRRRALRGEEPNLQINCSVRSKSDEEKTAERDSDTFRPVLLSPRRPLRPLLDVLSGLHVVRASMFSNLR